MRGRSQHEANNDGVLFRNDRKENDRHPDYKGQAKIDGQPYWVSAWLKSSRDGSKKYLSLAFTPKDELQQARQQPPDDIPW